MNNEQIQKLLLDHTRDISALQESGKSAHKRIGEMSQLTTAVHELAKSNAAVAMEVKSLATKLDKTIERIERGQQTQGERIGRMEASIQQIERNEREISSLADKLDIVRMEPGEKWKTLITHLVGYLMVGILGALAGNFIF